MEKQKQAKCYTYIRVSTDMQVDGYSLDAQRERLKKYADYQGYEIVREYCDAGKSGKSITGRPEFSNMLNDIVSQRDDISFVLVFKLSRFGRNAADVLNSLQKIQDYDVNLICVEDGIDSSKESGKLTITVLSAVAEIERDNILVQTMEGRKQKAREGKWNGGIAPFGYELDSRKARLKINEDEAKIVKKIFDLYAYSDMGVSKICDYLNESGFIKNKNREFETSYFGETYIRRILDNPVYIGKIAYGRYVTQKVKGTRDDYKRVYSKDYLISDGLHPAIIDEDTWRIVRVKREQTSIRWVKTHNLDHEHLLTGIIKCPCCGKGIRGMTNRSTPKKTGVYKDTFFYRCNNRGILENGKKCTYKKSLPQEKIDDEVANILLSIINDDKLNDCIIKKLKEKTDTSYLEEERIRLRESLKLAEGNKDKLIEQIDNLDVNDKHYERKNKDMQDRLDNLYNRINSLECQIVEVSKKISGVVSIEVSDDAVRNALANFEKIYYKMSDLEKKSFFRGFINSIQIYPEPLEDGRIVKEIELKVPFNVENNNEIVKVTIDNQP